MKYRIGTYKDFYKVEKPLTVKTKEGRKDIWVIVIKLFFSFRGLP